MSDQQENVSMNVSDQNSSSTIEDRDVPAPLSLLVSMRNIFDLMTQRAAFKVGELKSVGTVYETLNNCIVEGVKAAQEGATTDQPEETPTTQSEENVEKTL